MAGKNIFLFTGEDFRTRRKTLTAWVREFEKKHGDLSVTFFDMEKRPPLAEVTAGLFAAPFLGDKRCVVLKGFPCGKGVKMSEEQEAEETLLLSFLERIPESTFVMLDAPDPDLRRKVCKRILEIAEEKRFETNQGMTVDGKKYLELFPTHIKRMLLERIPAMVGNPQSELEKLALLQEVRALTEEDVEHMAPVKLEQDAFVLCRAMMEGDKDRLFRGIQRLKGQKSEILMFLGLLMWQIEQVILVKDMVGQGVSDGEISGALGIKPYSLSQAKPLARKVSDEVLHGLLDAVIAMEVMLKTGEASIDDPASFDVLNHLLYSAVTQK